MSQASVTTTPRENLWNPDDQKVMTRRCKQGISLWRHLALVLLFALLVASVDCLPFLGARYGHALDTECTVLRKVRHSVFFQREKKNVIEKNEKMTRKVKYVRPSNQPRVDSWNRLPLHVDVLLPAHKGGVGAPPKAQRDEITIDVDATLNVEIIKKVEEKTPRKKRVFLSARDKARIKGAYIDRCNTKEELCEKFGCSSSAFYDAVASGEKWVQEVKAGMGSRKAKQPPKKHKAIYEEEHVSEKRVDPDAVPGPKT